MRRGDDDLGFTLVEVIVSITLLLVVVVAATPLIINGIKFSAEQQRHQAAVIVTQEAMEEIRARTSGLTTPGPLVKGRHSSDVSAQFGRLAGHAGVALTAPASDSAAGAGSGTAVIPLTKEVQRDGTTYTVETLIGTCTLQKNAASEIRCLATGTGGKMVRAVVVTKWQASDTCTNSDAGYCSYEALTLISLDTDLEWNNAG